MGIVELATLITILVAVFYGGNAIYKWSFNTYINIEDGFIEENKISFVPQIIFLMFISGIFTILATLILRNSNQITTIVIDIIFSWIFLLLLTKALNNFGKIQVKLTILLLIVAIIFEILSLLTTLSLKLPSTNAKIELINQVLVDMHKYRNDAISNADAINKLIAMQENETVSIKKDNKVYLYEKKHLDQFRQLYNTNRELYELNKSLYDDIYPEIQKDDIENFQISSNEINLKDKIFIIFKKLKVPGVR